jgi:hypothetical protein
MKGYISVMGQPILLPLIKQLTPTVLANDIVGVQPMTGNVGEIFTKKFKVDPKPKYQFSRAKWYMAEFEWMNASQVFTWCTEQFGKMDRKPDAWSRWKTMPGNQIAFRDEKDYHWFVLRWGA